MAAPTVPADIGPIIDRVTRVHRTPEGVRLHHRESGPWDGPVVVLLHGIMGHPREWDVLTRALAVDHRVIALDQRGHGRSEWSGSYTAEAMARDVESLAEHLGLDRVTLVGHSMGGMVGLLLAAGRPDLVERLVVIDVGPASITSDLAAGLTEFLEVLAGAWYSSVDEAVEEWAAGNDLARPELLRHYAEHSLMRGADGRLTWCFDASGLVEFVSDGVREAQLWAAVDQVECPTLLVRGEHSPALAVEEAEEILTRLTDGREAVVRDGGHDLGVEQPEAVAAAVRAFLGAASGAQVSGSAARR